MLFSLWQGLQHRNPGLFWRNCLRGGRRRSYRPQLDPLEDRLLPVLGAVAVPAIAFVPGTLSGLHHLGKKPARGSKPIEVTVAENSSESVIHLGNVFGAMNGLQHAGGLQLSLLGNTKPGLVTTDLSDMDLTLTYTPGHCGTATITVGATDANDVFVKVTILVTVRPLKPAVIGGVSLNPAGASR